MAFSVKDLDENVQDLRQKGLKVTPPKMGVSGHRYSFTTDPDGISLELYEQ